MTLLPTRLALSAALALSFLFSVQAFAQEELRVFVRHLNDFEPGYDAKRHTYRDEWLRDVLFEPRTRPIEAAVIFPTRERIPQASTQDGKFDCEDIMVRVAPPGVTTVRWVVRGVHPITKKLVDLQTVTRPLSPLRPVVGSKCLPVRRPIIVTTKEALFRTSLSTASQTILPPVYTVRAEALNKNGQVVRSASREFSVPRTVPLIVSIGDSMASGQGNPDRAGGAKRNDCEDFTTLMLAAEATPEMHTKPKWFDARDYRSLLSAPARAAQLLLDEWPYVVFLSFAQSGAVVSSDQQRDLLEQLEQVRRVVGTHRIDALHMSIGGNDVEFANTLRSLTENFLGPGTTLATFQQRLDVLTNVRYPLINQKISSLGLNVSKILINQYPVSLFNDSQDRPRKGCGVFATVEDTPLGGVFLSITEVEARRVQEMGMRLNAAVADAATRHGWIFIDGIAAAFAGGGYCSGRSLFVFAEDSCERQGDFEGMMHPNVDGTRILARAIARELRTVLPKPAGIPVTK